MTAIQETCRCWGVGNGVRREVDVGDEHALGELRPSQSSFLGNTYKLDWKKM